MSRKIMLISLLAVAASLAEALGFVAGRGRGNDESEHGAQFVSVLRRRLESPVISEAKTGGGSLMHRGAGLRNSQRVQVSRAQLAALRQYRSWTEQKKAETIDLPMTIIKDLGAEYVGSIGIGTTGCPKTPPSESLKQDSCSHGRAQTNLTSVVFDTGSTNIWMASTLCNEGPCTNPDRQRYNPTLSKTFRDMQDSTELEVTFGSAKLKGPLGVDDFHIGPFTVKEQAFALIEEESGVTFTLLPLEGIVGLAFPSMAADNHVPFFDSVIKQKVLKKNMFCFYLSYGGDQVQLPADSLLSDGSALSDAQGARIGAILWGGYDEKLFDGDLMWFPVTKAHYWAIDLLEFRIGNESVPVSFADTFSTSLVQTQDNNHGDWGDNYEAEVRRLLGEETPPPSQSYLIVDTGTTYYTAEGDLYHTLASRLSSAACNDVDHYPPLTYVLKDIEGIRRELTITQEDYMTSDGHTCELGFMEVGPPKKYGPAMLLGELFMQKYFTVFDRGDGGDGDARIGIARSRNGALSSILEQSATKSRRELENSPILRRISRPSDGSATVLIDDSGQVELDRQSSN